MARETGQKFLKRTTLVEGHQYILKIGGATCKRTVNCIALVKVDGWNLSSFIIVETTTTPF